MERPIRGRVIKFGHNINTDVIIPAKYLVSIDPQELAQHAFEVLGEEFPRRLQAYTILLAGENFGCGSAREQAASCILGAGIKAIVACSFARVFYRNAINTGLPIAECPALYPLVEEGEEITVDFAQGLIAAAGGAFHFPPLPATVRQILEAGGLVPYLRQHLQEGRSWE